MKADKAHVLDEAPLPDIAVDEKPAIQVYRRKPLRVDAVQVSEVQELDSKFGKLIVDKGDWLVTEGSSTVPIKGSDFAELFTVDSGDLPDLDPGQTADWQGKRLVRVEVVAGRGPYAYWIGNAPSGEACGFKVVADQTNNPAAAHRAGRFYEAYEGKAGAKSWVILK